MAAPRPPAFILADGSHVEQVLYDATASGIRPLRGLRLRVSILPDKSIIATFQERDLEYGRLFAQAWLDETVLPFIETAILRDDLSAFRGLAGEQVAAADLEGTFA